MTDSSNDMKILTIIKSYLDIEDLAWLLVIAAAITTVFFFKLLWGANHINNFLSWEYIVNLDNFVQLGVAIAVSFSLYLLARFYHEGKG